MAKNTQKPYGRNIPEKSGETTATELTGRFNRTDSDINSAEKGSAERAKMGKKHAK